MNKNDVDDFFSSLTITFSEQWKAKLRSRLEKLKEEEKTGRYISKQHDILIQEMQNKGKHYLHKNFPNYKDQGIIEDIVQDTYIKWSNDFNLTKSSAKSPEHSFFLLLLKQAISAWYKKNIKTANAIQFDEKDYPIDELSEEIFRDEKLSSEDKGKRTGLVSIGGKQFSEDAWNELYKYYTLSERIPQIHNKNTVPQPIPKTIKKSTLYQNKPEFDNMSDASLAALYHFQYLKGSEKDNEKS